MNSRQATDDFTVRFSSKPLSACLESVKVPAKIPRSAFLSDGKLPIISQESDFINGYWDNEADAIHVDRSVVVFGDHTQVLKLIDFDFVVGADGVKILKPKEFLDAAYLRYFLEANPVPSLGYARHYRHISGIDIPISPLDEQKRIVAVLDQAFAALDRARAHAEANLVDAEVLRQRGADQLLDRYTGSAPKTLLGDLAAFRNGLNFSRHSSGESVKVAGVGDFKSNFWLPVDGLKSTIIEGRLSDDDRLRMGDILAVRSNGNKDLIGRVMLVGETDEIVSFSGFVIRIRVIAKGLKPEFLCHYMKSRGAVAHLLAGGGGANISNLNQGILSSLPIAIPTLEDQQKFVDSMNMLNMSIEKLAAVASSKLADLATLRQSLLQKAFSGELT